MKTCSKILNSTVVSLYCKIFTEKYLMLHIIKFSTKLSHKWRVINLAVEDTLLDWKLLFGLKMRACHTSFVKFGQVGAGCFFASNIEDMLLLGNRLNKSCGYCYLTTQLLPREGDSVVSTAWWCGGARLEMERLCWCVVTVVSNDRAKGLLLGPVTVLGYAGPIVSFWAYIYIYIGMEANVA